MTMQWKNVAPELVKAEACSENVTLQGCGAFHLVVEICLHMYGRLHD